MFENLPDNQRKILLFGAPVVAVFALVSTLGKRNQPAATSTATGSGTMPASFAPSTDAIGVGQLSDFESMITGAIAQLGAKVSTLPTTQQIQASLPAPIVNVAPAPAPAPAPPPTKTLTQLNSANFSVIAPQGSDMAVIGSAGGGQYNAGNLASGAPLYALIDGRWIQNFGDPKGLAAGTSLATLGTLKDYVVF